MDFLNLPGTTYILPQTMQPQMNRVGCNYDTYNFLYKNIIFCVNALCFFYKQRFLGAPRKLCRLGRGGGGSPKDDLLNRAYLIKTRRGEGGSKNRRFWYDIVYGRPLSNKKVLVHMKQNNKQQLYKK